MKQPLQIQHYQARTKTGSRYCLRPTLASKYPSTTGKTCIGKLSEFIGILTANCRTAVWRPFQMCFDPNSTNSTVFVAMYIKSKLFIGLELLISVRNTVIASMKNISAMNDGEDDDEPFRPFPIQRHFIVCKLKCSFIINRQQEQR